MINNELQRRLFFGGLAIFASAALIVLLNVIPMPYELAKCLVDKDGANVNYFAIQNIMWVMFFVGLSELFVRRASATFEAEALALKLLPEDEQTILNSADLVYYYKRSKSLSQYRLPRIINLVISQFQTSKSVSMCNDIMKGSVELYDHEIDLKYSFLRYILWAIPSVGFIGTVYGIAVALNVVKSADSSDPDLLAKTVTGLSVAFYTTLVALLMSCLLVLLMGVIQSREEKVLNSTARYCLNNLINRLYIKN